MNKFNSWIKKKLSSRQFKYGGYAAIVIIVGVAVVVLLNIALTSLESRFDLKIDTTANKQYTLDKNTVGVVSSLKQKIDIYTTYPVGSEDQQIIEIINKVKALSGNIVVENHDTTKEPLFTKAYTNNGETTISPGDIIVVSESNRKLFRILGSGDQYTYEMNQSTGETQMTQINVEGSLVNAINYINLGYIPTAHLIQGQGEAKLSDVTAITSALSQANFNLDTIDFLTAPDKVKAGDIYIMIDPKTDIIPDVRDKMKELMEKGGRFLFLFDPTTMASTEMPNLTSLMKLYNISLQSGMVLENDTNSLVISGNPFIYMPDLQTHDTTSNLNQNRYSVIIPYSGALKLPDAAPDATTITSLMKTSKSSYLKDPATLSTGDYSKKSSDPVGPFDIAAAVQKKDATDSNNDVKFVVIYDSLFTQQLNIGGRTYDLPTFTNNNIFFTKCVVWLSNAQKDIGITPKLVTTTMMNMTVSQEWVIFALVVIVLPLLLGVAGIVVYLRRKHL